MARSSVSQRPLETLEKLKELESYNLEEEMVQGSHCEQRQEGMRMNVSDHPTHTVNLQMGKLTSADE